MIGNIIRHNKAAAGCVGAGLLAALTACVPYAKWAELSGPKPVTAGQPTPIENTPAWQQAVKSGQGADWTADAAHVAGFVPLPGVANVAHGVEGFSAAYAQSLYTNLKALEKRQDDADAKLGAAPTQADVYKAMIGAGLVGTGGILFRRKQTQA